MYPVTFGDEKKTGLKLDNDDETDREAIIKSFEFCIQNVHAVKIPVLEIELDLLIRRLYLQDS